MNDGFHFLDIVFFAMVAAFLVLRLRSVLGRRTGAERPPEKWIAGEAPGENVIDLGKARRAAAPVGDGTPVGDGIAAIQGADRAFDPVGFIAGARGAFEIILGAFAAGDKARLKPLLAPDVFRHFADAIDARLRQGEVLTTELVGIRTAETIDARLDGTIASVTVRFVSEQVNALRGRDGQVIEGNPERVVDVIDEWTFRRDTRSADPNWALAATHSPEV